ncbi:MAG: GGDEF domain-containing protein [Pseudomonadota bacterium]
MDDVTQADRQVRSDPLNWAESLQQRRLEMTVMYYLGGTTVLVVSMFAVYRFVTGDSTGGLTNSIIVSMLMIALVLGRFPRYQNWALIMFGLVSTVSCLLSTLIVGSNGLLWTYLVLWINMLILPRWMAAALNGAIIVLYLLNPSLFTNLLHEISWAAVAIMFSTFGIVFTSQLRNQRRILAMLATQDPLTSTGNRRLMQHDLEDAVRRQGRRKRPATVVVLDLDHFKSLNDQFGHEAGDQALADFSDEVRTALRAEDGFYRMGGEEFVILLRNMDEEAALRSLPEMHERLSGATQGPGGPLQFSAGAATLKPREGWSRWLARADAALYRAKAGGRNRLEIAG